MNDNICDACRGTCKNIHGKLCTFCNGTAEWNQAAQTYVQDHICQCIRLDRKFCPICGVRCHHDSSQTPKQTIDPGFGGASISIMIISNRNITTLPSDVERQFYE